jgi:protein-S-isoprenylcysteine O-methyltransferase Ste14
MTEQPTPLEQLRHAASMAVVLAILLGVIGVIAAVAIGTQTSAHNGGIGIALAVGTVALALASALLMLARWAQVWAAERPPTAG